MQTLEANLTSIRIESGEYKQMLTLLEEQDQIIQELQQENERLNAEQTALTSLVENYRNQLSDWQAQSSNQQKQLNDYLSSDAGKLQKEITKLKKCLEKAEADNFCEMIQRRHCEEIAETWKRSAEKRKLRKGV